MLWATATDAADQESDPSNVVTITVEVQPPLKTLERSPFPAGYGLRGTSHTGLWTNITLPGVPHLIDPSRPHPVNQATYPVKGIAG